MQAYTCYYRDCQKIYNSKYNLIRHINSFHLDTKSYTCQFCTKGFYNKQSLDSHLSTRTCESSSTALSAVPYDLISQLSSTHGFTPKMQEPTPLNLPVLPKIEFNRQIPLKFAKFPIIQILFQK